ncbi:MAG: hypothetical protein IT334_00860 [Thermomicrobiales bacterium]|nr:hypothetical protein [Thermomicrobiales bacterium]
MPLNDIREERVIPVRRVGLVRTTDKQVSIDELTNTGIASFIAENGVAKFWIEAIEDDRIEEELAQIVRQRFDNFFDDERFQIPVRVHFVDRAPDLRADIGAILVDRHERQLNRRHPTFGAIVKRVELILIQVMIGKGAPDLVEREREIRERNLSQESIGPQPGERKVGQSPADYDEMGIQWKTTDELLERGEHRFIHDRLEVVNDHGQCARQGAKPVLNGFDTQVRRKRRVSGGILVEAVPESFEEGATTVVLVGGADPDRRCAARGDPLTRQRRLSVTGRGGDQRDGRKQRPIDEIDESIPDDATGR